MYIIAWSWITPRQNFILKNHIDLKTTVLFLFAFIRRSTDAEWDAESLWLPPGHHWLVKWRWTAYPGPEMCSTSLPGHTTMHLHHLRNFKSLYCNCIILLYHYHTNVRIYLTVKTTDPRFRELWCRAFFFARRVPICIINAMSHCVGTAGQVTHKPSREAPYSVWKGFIRPTEEFHLCKAILVPFWPQVPVRAHWTH